jgi:hypothetical protein
VAQDALGEAAAGEWYAAAKPTYTTLIDRTHLVTELYNLVNVPSGIWVDEEGRVRRINEGTYSRVIALGAGSIGTDEYTPAVRDWVMKGEESRYVWSPEEMVRRIRQHTPDEALADPTFKLGVYFYPSDEALARTYWERAQALAPDNWNYHRQDWNLIEGLAGPQYREKRGALGDKPYYAPLDLPEVPDAAQPRR